jgi:hypothetical protein
MAFALKITGATFTNYAAEAIPSYSKLDFFALYGADAATSNTNHVGDKAAASVVGTPTYGSNYAIISEANGFESALAAAGSPFTHIVVTTNGTGGIGWAGRWKTAATRSLLLGGASLAIDGNIRATTALSASGYNFVAGSHDGSTAIVYKGASGALTNASAAYVGGAATTTFRVGAHGFSTGTANVAAAMTANEVLSGAEILALYQYLTRLLATRGVTVN